MENVFILDPNEVGSFLNLYEKRVHMNENTMDHADGSIGQG